MIAIRYRVTLEEPVLVTALAGDPNSAVAFDYLPGSVLRGALIGRMLGQNLTHDVATRRRFFDNNTRFLNAYPISGDQRMLPTPYSWIKQGEKVVDELLSTQSDPGIKRKRVQEAFHHRLGGDVRLHTPDHHVAIHIERSRVGVPQGDQGEVYRYDSLAEGTTFEGVILCDHTEDASYFETKFQKPFTLWLGGARTAGYGRTRWTFTARDEAWHEHTLDEGDGDWLIVFLSPALIRDKNGQYAADQTTILEHLGIEHAVSASIDREMIGGFNRKWGLPLPQTLAVSPGSVLRVSALPPNFDRISMEQMGIGERRVDGFGRVAIYRQKTKEFGIHSLPNSAPIPAAVSPAYTTALAVVRERIHRERKRQTIEERAHNADHLIKKAPRRTQLNALREAVASGIRMSSPSVQPVQTFLSSTDNRYFSRAQFEEARINGQSLMTWLRGVLDGTQEEDITRLGDRVDVKAALRLIDAVAARATRIVEKGKRS